MLFSLILFPVRGKMLILRPQIHKRTILNRVVLFLVVLLIAASCRKNDQFTVSGRVSHAEGDTIYLEEILLSGYKPVAQAKINKKGEFKMKGKAGAPAFYLLKLSPGSFITLLIDSTEQIVVEADAANFGKQYAVEGSLGSIQVKELNARLSATEHKLDSIRTLMNLSQARPDYESLKTEWMKAYAKIKDEQREFSNNFIVNNPFSMASVYALYQKYRDDGSYVTRDLQTMRTAASALYSIYPNSEMVVALYENTKQRLREEQAGRVRKFIEEHGENSPDIVLPDPDGKEIALSSLRGKVVLLHFWAAEDRGSRVLNPLLVEAYRKYKNKGFEIYQVNVGKNRSEWIDAIDTDRLSWINVGDLEGSVKAVTYYNVQSIPFNYLLDRDGTILRKNLSGPALDKTLGEILK